MKKPIFVDEQHEYDYELELAEEGTLHTLSHSQSNSWNEHVKATMCMQILDDGNGFHMLNKFNKKNFDYSEAEHLYILLTLCNSPAKYEIATKESL